MDREYNSRRSETFDIQSGFPMDDVQGLDGANFMKKMIVKAALFSVLALKLGGCGDGGGDDGGDPAPPAPPPVVVIPVDASGLWEGKLKITNKKIYERFLEKFLIICDRGWSINFTTTPTGQFVDIEDCDTHKDAGYVYIYRSNDSHYWLDWSAGYHAQYAWFDLERERQFEVSYSLFNDSQGFTLIASDVFGGAWLTQGFSDFRMEVEFGSTDDVEIQDAHFFYEGNEFAKASTLRDYEGQ